MNELLTRIGWSQAHFSRVIGVSPQTVGRWGKDGAPGVTIKYLELVARLLGV